MADRLLDTVRNESDVELSLVSRSSAVSFGIVDGLTAEVDGDGIVRVAGELTIDPDSVLFGRPLDDGLWDLRVRLRFAGFNRSASVAPTSDDALPSRDHPARPRGQPLRVDVVGRRDSRRWAVGRVVGGPGGVVVRCAGGRPSALELQVDVVTAVPGPVSAEVLLEPLERTDGGVLAGEGQLRVGTATAVSAQSGCWPCRATVTGGLGAAGRLGGRFTGCLAVADAPHERPLSVEALPALARPDRAQRLAHRCGTAGPGAEPGDPDEQPAVLIAVDADP